MARKKGLGRGVGALIPVDIVDEFDINSNDNGEKIINIDINLVAPNKNQPRKFFDKEQLEELANSIKEKGVIQPILVVKKGEGYIIVAGERRYRASKIAELKNIPAIVKDFSEVEIMEIALIENLQRQDLNAVEEALGYKRLNDEFLLSFDDISKRVGRSKGSISNSLSLLKLATKVQDLIYIGKLNASQGRILLKVEDEKLQCELAEEAIERDLSAHMLDEFIDIYFITKEKELEKNYRKNYNEYSSIINEFENDLQNFLGLKVKINDKNKKGKLEIAYTNHDELENLIKMLKR
ncbi:MAG: ParB/RepB/Spo0J family partition protein [Lachnospirales bacterium]